MSSNIEYHKFSKGETCSTTGCRSKHYYIQDGKRVCKAHGHVQEGFTQVQQDEDDFNTQGRKSRRKREEEKAVNRTYEGKAAVTLYVQCWQLILRKQVRWMVVEKHLPEELEKVVRDLWALRIRAVKGLGEEFEGDGASTGFSSTSEGETEVEDGVGIEMRRRLKKLARAKGLPKLIETLAMCYSAVLLMRLPVTVGDMFAWVGQPGFPYLRAAKEIPQDMKSHLPGKYLSALETRGRLKLGRLQKAVMDLIFQLKMNFEVALPPMNVSLVLFHQVKKLCLPLEIYQCVLRLARLLGFDFRWPTSLERHFVTEYPEIRLVALIVTATKLVVTFDDFPRNPENIASPSTLKMDWTAWEKLVKAKKEAQKQASFDEVKMTEQDVFDMSTLDIDKYLNWYQETWLDDRAPKIPEQILDLFPVPPAPTRSELEQLGQAEMDTASPAKRLKQVQSSQRVQEPISTEQAEYIATVNRPGSYYQRSRVIEELNDHEKNFVALAAETIAVSAHELLRAVNTIENTLFKAISPPEMMDETYDIEEVGEGQSSP